MTLSYACIIDCLKPFYRWTIMISVLKDSSSKTMCFSLSFLLVNLLVHQLLYPAFQVYYRMWKLRMRDLTRPLVHNHLLNNRGDKCLSHMWWLSMYILWWNFCCIIRWTSGSLSDFAKIMAANWVSKMLFWLCVTYWGGGESWPLVTNSDSVVFSTKCISFLLCLLDIVFKFSGFLQTAPMK